MRALEAPMAMAKGLFTGVFFGIIARGLRILVVRPAGFDPFQWLGVPLGIRDKVAVFQWPDIRPAVPGRVTMRHSTITICAVLALFAAQLYAEDVDVESEIEAGRVAFNRGDVVAAMMHYETAANAGSADAMARLAWILDQSEQNEDAVKWYRASAEQGHAGGYFGLGEMYAKGEGVTEDDAQALEYFMRAAENGHAQAMAVLASAYEKGELGVEADAAKAAQWRDALQQQSGRNGE